MLIARGISHNVVGKGKVLIKLAYGSINSIDYVLYMPGIHRNLLSVGCIFDQGSAREFIKNLCLIRDIKTNMISFEGIMSGKNNLYKLIAECL